MNLWWLAEPAAWLPPEGPETVFLGLGGNIGDRLRYLQRAVALLQRDDRTDVDDVSSVYQTAPVGPDQPPFANVCVRARTTRTPLGVLRLSRRVEATLGRVRARPRGPRTIDVDVLLYGDRTVVTPQLQVPHPRLTERAFAIVPLMEVAAGWRLPDGRSLAAAAAALAPIEGVHQIGRQIRVPAQQP